MHVRLGGAFGHAQEGQSFCAQRVAKQAGRHIAVVRLLLDHGARGDHQGCTEFVGSDAVVEILQRLIENLGFADIGEVCAGLCDDCMQTVEVQRGPGAVCLNYRDIAGSFLGGR